MQLTLHEAIVAILTGILQRKATIQEIADEINELG